jgi:cysteine desulfurase
MILQGFCEINNHAHIITSDIEHSSIFNTIKALEKKGHQITFLSPTKQGSINPEDVKAHIRHNTRLIILSAVNSETGVKNDIHAIAAIAKEGGLPFAVDAVALLGKEPFTIPDGVAAMAFSGHKLHAPKGIGLTFVRSSIKLSPLLTGGEQEYSKRAGTENLSGILGLAKAVDLLNIELPVGAERMRVLRDRLEKELIQSLGDILVNGSGPRIANTTNLCFLGVDGEALLISLDRAGIAASHGSACASGALEPSRVLLNMGIPKDRARSSIRFSLSRFTTEEEIDHALNIICEIVRALRKER